MTFHTLADHLNHGREIEFVYLGNQYSITNSNQKWHFCCDTDKISVTLCAFADFHTLVEKTAAIKIEDLTIKEIFDRNLYDAKYLYIL